MQNDFSTRSIYIVYQHPPVSPSFSRSPRQGGAGPWAGRAAAHPTTTPSSLSSASFLGDNGGESSATDSFPRPLPRSRRSFPTPTPTAEQGAAAMATHAASCDAGHINEDSFTWVLDKRHPRNNPLE